MAAAVFRSAARGVLQRPHASSFRRALFANKETMPREGTGPRRRLYSSDSSAKAEPSTFPHLHLLETVGKSGHETPMAVLPPKEMKPLERTFLTLDEVDRILDRHAAAMKELGDAIQDMVKRNRRNRLLLRGAALGAVGGAIYMMQRFFGRQEDKETTASRD